MPARREKYEGIQQYWIDVETTGSWENENEETLLDITSASGFGEEMDLGLTPVDPAEREGGAGGGEESSNEDEDDALSSAPSKRQRPTSLAAESAMEDQGWKTK